MPPTDANIVLIGYRGVGKTSLARELARRLGREWFDADDDIERAAGKTIAAIFSEDGEAAFRDWESGVIARLAAQRGVILATGGGAVLRPENRAALAKRGRFVWLQASPDTIYERIHADGDSATRRPLLTTLQEREEIRTLLLERSPIYAELAEATIDTDGKSIPTLADEIMAALGIARQTEAT